MLLLHVEATVVQGHMALGFHLDVYKLLEEACTSVYIYCIYILNFAICMLCMTLFVNNNFKCIYIYTHTHIYIYMYIYVIAPI